MYKFIKEIDSENKYDKSKVTFEIPETDLTLDELLEVFEDFCRACGYAVKRD